MKKIAAILVIVCMILSFGSFGQSGWESATNVGQERTGDGMLTRCIYQTIGGYRFSTVVRGTVCPFSVMVNPETGQVKK